ncbi:MAG: BglII/BstYI family type II restriction endonuclease [candidate division WOR-3 bacterium]
MRKVYEYSHLGGLEILRVRYPVIESEIDEIIEEVQATKTKISKEKGKMGKLLYDPKEMNRAFRWAFAKRGFKELRSYHDMRFPYEDERLVSDSVKVFKQIDFQKDRVLVEVQLGKYAFMFYDLAKFQYFFNEGHCDAGVEIVPAYALHKEMSSGVSYGEQLIEDIERLKRHFPAVPIKVILIDI